MELPFEEINMIEAEHLKTLSSQLKDNRFIEPTWFQKIDGDYRLMGSVCGNCGKVSFPKKPFCPSCFNQDQEDMALSKTGILHTFSQSVMGPKDMNRPYVIGFIDLPEGIKLYSLITDCDPWDSVLKIDMEMQMVIRKIKTDEAGNEILGYCFAPASQQEESI